MHNQRRRRLDRGVVWFGTVQSLARSGGLLGVLLAIANSVRNDQFRPRKRADGEFVDFLIRFVAVDRYDGADRPHIVAAIGESVLIVRLLRLCRNAVSRSEEHT